MKAKKRGPATAAGRRIKEIRTERGMSRMELAVASKMSVQAIIKYEHGDRDPSWESVLAITKALGVTPNELAELVN